MISVDAVNKTFPRYPMTVHDKGWIYGVWYCGTAWTKAKLHGQYPGNFLKRARALFPETDRILHCPSGTIDGDITVDLIVDVVRQPMIQATAEHLPFIDGAFDLILSDPPYTEKDSEIYGTPKWRMGRAMNEFRRVLRPGGHLGMLHTYYPSYRRKEWRLVGLIAVVTGFMRATRMFSIFEKIEQEPTLWQAI